MWQPGVNVVGIVAVTELLDVKRTSVAVGVGECVCRARLRGDGADNLVPSRRLSAALGLSPMALGYALRDTRMRGNSSPIFAISQA
jgi:hypothetical protein